jgi:membrane-associated phospholipid phosphatase
MRLSALDRRTGAAVRTAAGRVPGGPALAAVAAAALAPAFRLAVAALILRRRSRAAGLEALSAGAVAATLARELRDRLGRPRPGPRGGGGLPSRHAAAALAIARSVRRHDRRAGAALALAAAVGLTGRVVARHHDPADILAGALLGAASGAAVGRTARLVGARRHGCRR